VLFFDLLQMEEYILTEEDINSCIKAFEDLDDDRNELISIYDFDTALRRVGIEYTEIELAKLISELDINNTGFIKFAAFM
jgi:Ca2+-binding EF-hand superfamily protein